jgi:hypothetical protein
MLTAARAVAPWGRRAVSGVRRRLGRLRQHLRDLAARRLPDWPEPERSGRAARPDPPDHRPEVRIEVDTVGGLRRQLSDPAAMVTTTHLEVVVRRWRPPMPGWSGRLGPLADVVRHEVCLPGAEVVQGGGGRASVTVTVSAPVPVARLVVAALAGLTPVGAPADPATAEPVREARRVGALAELDADAVVVDATTANPCGRRLYGPSLTAGRLTVADRGGEAWWRVTRVSSPSGLLVTGQVGQALDERQADTLARIGVLTADPVDGPGADPGDGPIEAVVEARALAQLAATGVVVSARALPASVRELLAPDLAELLGSPPPGLAADKLDWEIRSVRQRRAALRGHGATFALPRSSVAEYPSLARPAPVSALLVTRRPHLLSTAVTALAAQTYPDLEIVVGLHGIDPSPAERERLAALHPGLLLVDIPPQWNLGEALGEVTRRARGSLLAKVDDDDRYGPEHVWDLVLARDFSGATVAGKGAEFVYLRPRDLTVRRRMTSEAYAEVVAGGAMLIGRGDLEAVGGWRPMERHVDRGLLDRVLGDGGLIYRTHGFGFVYTRHGDGHTWDAGMDYFVRDATRRWDGQLRHDEFGDAG